MATTNPLNQAMADAVANPPASSGSGSGSGSSDPAVTQTFNLQDLVDPSTGVEANPPSPAAIPFTLPSNLDGFNAARGAGNYNTLGINNAQPIVQPPVTLWHQYDPLWNVYWMRPQGQRCDPAKFSTKDNWAQNGCHPTCLAMVLDWWSSQNPATLGGLSFPFPNVLGSDSPTGFEPAAKPSSPETSGTSPLMMCRQMFGTPYVLTTPSGPQAAGTEFNVDNDGLRNSVQPSDNPSRTGITALIGTNKSPMQSVVYSNGGDRDNFKAAIKFLLELGPIIVLLKHPGHYVVGRGYRNDTMYMYSPGSIVLGQDYWGTSSKSDMTVCPDSGGQNMVQVNCLSNSLIYISKTGALTGLNWLDNIVQIEGYYFDANAVHPDWSDPSKSTL